MTIDWNKAKRELAQEFTPLFERPPVAKRGQSVLTSVPQGAPQIATVTDESMQELEQQYALFARPLARTQELILDKASVDECLEQIKRLQLPEMSAIRERERQRERIADFEARRRQVFHAQIISIAA